MIERDRQIKIDIQICTIESILEANTGSCKHSLFQAVYFGERWVRSFNPLFYSSLQYLNYYYFSKLLFQASCKS